MPKPLAIQEISQSLASADRAIEAIKKLNTALYGFQLSIGHAKVSADIFSQAIDRARKALPAEGN